ncbi:hypothetical protein ACFX13_023739 [Malus domestica]
MEEYRRGELFGLEAKVLVVVGFGLVLARERWVERESEGEEAGGEFAKRSIDDDGAPIAEAMDCWERSGGELDRQRGRRQRRNEGFDLKRESFGIKVGPTHLTLRTILG